MGIQELRHRASCAEAWPGAGIRRVGATCLLAGSSLLAPAVPALAQQADNSQPMEEVTVTAPRLDLLGTASTASEGVVDDQEMQLTPAYRPGQLLETVPGLTVTSHSGEGKANQYLMRGYNLDHGTDLETYVDGMPINQPTHAHGQGYTDLNFMIPELADEITYTKGPYYADVGDFGAVGSVRVELSRHHSGPGRRDRRHAGLRAPLQRAVAGRSATGNCSRPSSCSITTARSWIPTMRARRMSCCATARLARTTAFR